MPKKAKNSRKNSGKRGCQVQELAKESLVPCPRDQRAFRLSSEGWSQRRIAEKLKCSQPTVQRGIAKAEKWMATTLPEDRGELTDLEKFRVVAARHEIFLERLQRKALREWERSRQTRHVKKTKTKVYPEGRKHGADEITEVHTEEYDQPQYGRIGCLNSAARISHELTVLAAGYLGPGEGGIAFAEAIDPDERKRWQRAVDSRDARIAELEQQPRSPQAVGCMSASEMHAECGPPLENPIPEWQASSRLHFANAHAPYRDVSPGNENEPVMNQSAAICEDASANMCGSYDDIGDSPAANLRDAQTMNQCAVKSGCFQAGESPAPARGRFSR